MNEERVKFHSGNLSLEGMVSIPVDVGIAPAVIVCHPHPLYGGDMDNNVVYAICQALSQKSFISFRFNFRGVGGSEGSFSQGTSEQEDVAAAVSFLTGMNQVDASRIGIAGYSAGAAFGLPAGVKDERVKALAAISPPLSISDFEFLIPCTKPKLLISGSEDNFTSPDELLRLCRSIADPKECEIVEGADHFWQGHESALANRVTGFFEKALTKRLTK